MVTSAITEEVPVCHCGQRVTATDDPWQDRVLAEYCTRCRELRCDAFPGACRGER